jgi:outer membrane scaffolding protein for murein synthesis (MipA/OmpV family)
LLDSEPPYFKGDGILSALVSISASYRITHSWSARVTWNRVVTRYSHDTDVILCGIGYRF